MTTLLIDNYDSYTFNLYQLLASVAGEEPVVVRNDETQWGTLAAHPWDRIVVSPGPGRPERERDLGIGRDALAQREIPVLGVCLGHQGLAHVHGASVVRAEQIVHGQISRVFHSGEGLFENIPQGFHAVRYHSLVVEPALPAQLEAVAWADDGTLMALCDRERPAWGVQFHPESIGTEHGEQLVANFIALSPGRRSPRSATALPHSTVVPGGRAPAHSSGAVQVAHRVVDAIADAESSFATLFGDRAHAFWLDSSRVDRALSRFSFMGAAIGGLGAQVRYSVAGSLLSVTRGGETRVHAEKLLEYLSRELARLHTASPELPFDLNGGFVGYLGYELKADCGATAAHESDLPDAFLLLADRIVALDHELGRTHLLALSDGSPREVASAEDWLAATAETLDALPVLGEPRMLDHGQAALEFTLSRGREHYKANIETCKRLLESGESYEICLTNKLTVPALNDTFELYRVLRRVNPAPYSAYLRMQEGAVLSSSPERFLRATRDRMVEAKPIKGTARRGADPAADGAAREALARSPKDRAEHLMIVDLLRNDLGLVSQIGSVHVSRLMAVESYETVHQLVSTIRGRLRDDVDLVDCIRATFPGGSMTGAPKLRTMEIIDALEGAARGVYSGALGYLALNGTADLSIVIRTLVTTQAGAAIGSGGAIVMLSDAEDEYDEMLLKAQPLLDAVSMSGAALAPAPGAGIAPASGRPGRRPRD
ncbi:MAG: Para-aminobenzoate synthase, amidotransferase component / Para-aminobenzoate synthase, aminase component [uncultured Solirubrobacteraceae bacterium]|uniref:aminodeoxychorismate synthase n=1 Tax=uncultured Solirubrobacteraceae bacterium TaxID=1162706 RepID=A0A6J4RZ16_9ACTN|nr:MAG: Para-aminobenzoate synthase, amidotransferase component / Para-aminobenzoate synthase, aminase component [uncultured Solirubrobacteraceae bacterium]